MRKVAIFVEGTTELVFVKKLIVEMCGARDLTFEVQRQFGGALIHVSFEGPQNPPAETFVLLANCSTDGQVLTQIRDRYFHLEAAGYERIIGIRDLYPDFSAVDLPKLRQMTAAAVPVGAVPISLHYAVLETEAWFLDERTHFERVSPLLTLEHIEAAGFDLTNIPGDQWPHPAETLNLIYRLAKFAWRKKGAQISRTVDALSIPTMLAAGRARSASFDSFVADLELALF